MAERTRMDGNPIRDTGAPKRTRLDSDPRTATPSAPGVRPGVPTRLDGTRPPGPSRPSAAAAAVYHTHVLPPRLVPHFEVLGRAGEAGAEGVVYKCRDLSGYVRPDSMGALFAIKVYTREPTFTIDFGTPEYRERFDNAYAVQVFERGSDDGNCYDIMEFCEAGTILDILADLPGSRMRSHAEATTYLREFAEDLRGIQLPESDLPLVHGDIKPENVLVRSMMPLDLILSDFGLSVALRDRSKLSNTGKGSYLYMAPGAEDYFTLASDWWGVGMLVYRILVGRDYFSDAEGRPFTEKRVRNELATKSISLDAVLQLNYLSELERNRWVLVLTGLLTRDPDERWGYRQVRDWLKGKSPDVGSLAPTAGGSSPSADPRTRATVPFALPMSPDFWTLDELRTWMAANPEQIARGMTGRKPKQLIAWVRAEFDNPPTFSRFDAGWSDRDVKAAYLVSQINPDAAILFAGYPLNGRRDLIALSEAAANNSAAMSALRSLYDSDLVSAIESDTRPGFARIDADWRGYVDAATHQAQQHGVALEPENLAQIMRSALAIASDESGKYVGQIRDRIRQSTPQRNIGWFDRLTAGGHR